jgi:sugar lactone lactonase YvrE
MEYHWTITKGMGTLASNTGPSVSFRIETGLQTELTCQARNPKTGETGSGTHRVLLLTPGPMAPPAIQALDRAARQGPLVAWVANPVEGVTYYWEIEGGQALGPQDQSYLPFRAGTGAKVGLTCLAIKDGSILSQSAHTVALVELTPPCQASLAINAPAKAARGKGVRMSVASGDGTKHSYRWRIEGGEPREATGEVLEVTAGNGAKIKVLCLATRLDTGAMTGSEHEIELCAPMVEPEVTISGRVYQGHSKSATVTNRPAGDEVNIIWSFESGAPPLGSVPAAPSMGSAPAAPPMGSAPAAPPMGSAPAAPSMGSAPAAPPMGSAPAASSQGPAQAVPFRNVPNSGTYTFIASRTGPATLTCRFHNQATGEVTECKSKDLEVLPARAPVAAARIGDFKCDPPGPLEPDTHSATLYWTLDRQPDKIVLKETVSGVEYTVPNPSDRSFPLAGLLSGRANFTLTTIVKDRDLDLDVTDTKQAPTIVVPGVTVLAGDAVSIGAGYMKEFTPGVTPWDKVSGLAWKSPWLYFSQGAQHTIRRVQPSEGIIEEVAGMRGIAGTGRQYQDRLFDPGQLIHRQFTAGGLPVEDWLVLQPKARCIQVFTEGQVAATMQVLVGSFPGAPPSEKPQPKKPLPPLKNPTAMAVHGLTGHLFVADLGSRHIRMYSPMGEEVKTIADSVEAHGLAVNRHGDVFYADPAHHVVRVLRHNGADLNFASTFAPPEVFAGAVDQEGASDGARVAEARFRQPRGLAMDTDDCDYLLIADTGNHLVRKVPADTVRQEAVETVGGNVHAIQGANVHMAVHPNGMVAMLDEASKGIRLISPDASEVHNIPIAHAWPASGIALDLEGNLFCSDPGNHVVWAIRRLTGLDQAPTYGPPEVFAGRHGCAGKAEDKRPAAPLKHPDPLLKRTETLLLRPEGLALDSRDPKFLLITDGGTQTAWRVPVDLSKDLPMKEDTDKPSLPNQAAGNAGCKDGPAAESQFSHPQQLCGDGHGGLFVQDQNGSGQCPLLRVIDLAGEVRTLGGINLNTTKRGRVDGLALEAGFNGPVGIAVAPSGHLLVADRGNRCVRRIDRKGNVTVLVGTSEDANDKGTVEDASFHALTSLGIDALGRILFLDPKANKLRMVDLGMVKPPMVQPSEVVTILDQVNSDRVATFPSSGSSYLGYPMVIARPFGDMGETQLEFRASPRQEIVDPNVKLQALCTDRRNRIWVVAPTDPSNPGNLRIQRYSVEMPRVSGGWHKEGATLSLFPLGAQQELDGRPHALCAAPRITAMATDSHHNLFLADSGNGLLWKVDEQAFTAASLAEANAKSKAKAEARAGAKADPKAQARVEAKAEAEVEKQVYQGPACLSVVAGQYPFLGPLGKKLTDPLLPMQGLALTPDDDLVVTCGNAVLLVVQDQPQAAPKPWEKTQDLLIPRPAPPPAKERGGQAPAPPKQLRDPNAHSRWSFALDKGEERLLEARNALLMKNATQRSAKLAYQGNPSSMAFMNKAEALSPVIARAEDALRLVEAEMGAKMTVYTYLMAVDYPPNEQVKTTLGLAKAESNLAQLHFECLLNAQEKEAMLEVDPRRPALQAHLDYLKALQAAYATEAEQWRSLGRGAGGSEPSSEQIEKIGRQREIDLLNAEQAAKTFEGTLLGRRFSRYDSWADGKPPLERLKGSICEP